MILLEVDPNVVKPGWTPLIITVVLAAAIALLMLSMRRQMRKIDVPHRADLQAGGSTAAESTAAGSTAAGSTGDEDRAADDHDVPAAEDADDPEPDPSDAESTGGRTTGTEAGDRAGHLR